MARTYTPAGSPRAPTIEVVDLPALLDLLADRGESLATAESLTGGRLAATVTAVPGCSRVFVGGVVSYATRLKRDLLGVPEEVLLRDGVVSDACARAMAAGVRERLGATWALATTGVAGPGPEAGVPAGRAYVALAGPAGGETRRLDLAGSREEVALGVVEAALALLDGVAGPAPVGPTGEEGPLG
jgi:nicotinamide-nucleotide amidase